MEIVKVTYENGLKTKCLHLQSEKTIETAAPVDNNGDGSSFSPTDLLCTTLASCCITIMAIKSAANGFELGAIETKVSKLMNLSPRRVGKIEIGFSFDRNYSEDQKRILKDAAENCPVYLSLHPDTKKELHFIYPS